MAIMQSVRNRARLLAAIALAWHVVVIGAVSTALSCQGGAASDHAGMKDCPLHSSAPVCPLHGDKHGTHECDCPTIGCTPADAGFMALFGAVGILSHVPDMDVPIDAGDAAPVPVQSAIRLAPAPLSPPPRS